MNIEKGKVISLVSENTPVPGCTISGVIAPDITVFSLAEGTDISAEHYPEPVLYLGQSGQAQIFTHGEPSQSLSPWHVIYVSDGKDTGVIAPSDCIYIEIGLNSKTIMNQIVKNREVFALKDLVPYQEGKIVNMDIASNDKMKFMVMAFDAGQGLREHAAPGDAMVFALDGEGVIGYEGKEYLLKAGEQFVFEKRGLHSVRADKRFKMALLLTLE